MLKRALFVAAAAAFLVPLAAAPAQASCLDDFSGSLNDGYYGSPKSQYWATGYVQQSGSATVNVQGDALVSDYTSYAGDLSRWAPTVVGNTPGSTTDFVECVAG